MVSNILTKINKRSQVQATPEGWAESPFGNFFLSLKNGFTRRPRNDENGPIVLRLADVVTGKIDLSDIRRVEMSAVEFDQYKLLEGDLLFTRVNGSRDYVGRCIYVDRNYSDVAYNDHLIRVRLNKFLNGKYAQYLIDSETVRSRLLASIPSAIGGQLTINQSALENLSIVVPSSTTEQVVIANALTDTDALISSLGLLIEKKKNIKTATMQQLLNGRRRIQGFKGKWEKKRLGELLAYEQPTRYLVKGTEYNNSNETPVLTAGKTFILGYTDETAGIFNELPVIIFDDFTTANKYVTFPFKAKSSAMKMLRPRNKEINLRFVFEKMQLIDFKLGDHKRYWISEYQNIELEMPQPEEQTAIASVLSDMDDEITKLETRFRKTRELKQGMMQQLLTGNIRLI